MTTRKFNQNTLELGQWNVLCDVCGMKFKSGDIKKRWDGLRVCAEDWEPRHPMDFFRGRKDDQGVAYSRTDGSGADGSGATGTDIEGNPIPTSITILSTSIDQAFNGVLYSFTVLTDAPQGTGFSYTWSVSSGSMPSGLSLDTTTGIISGTPTALGEFTFTLTVVDDQNGSTDDQAYTTTVGAGVPTSFSLSTIPIYGDPTQPGGYPCGRAYFDDGTMVKMGGAFPNTINLAFLDEDTETWSDSVSKIPENSAGVRYLVSEYNNQLIVYFNGGAIYSYDKGTDTWTLRATGLYLSGPQLAESGNIMYVFGGNYNSTAINRYEVRTLNMDTWTLGTASTDCPKNISGAFAVTLNDGNILVGGGATPFNSGAAQSTCWIYNTTDGSWTATTDKPAGMVYPFTSGGNLLSDGRPIIWGGQNNGTGIRDTEAFIYDPSDETWETIDILPVNFGVGSPLSVGGYTIYPLASGNYLVQNVYSLGFSYLSSSV